MGGRAFVLRLWWALAGPASEFCGGKAIMHEMRGGGGCGLTGMRLPSTILGGLEELMC